MKKVTFYQILSNESLRMQDFVSEVSMLPVLWSQQHEPCTMFPVLC